VQAALVGFFMLLLVFARAGGVGIVDGPAPFQTAKNEPLPASISLRCVRQGTYRTHVKYRSGWQLAVKGAEVCLTLSC
jgi:hypothetical protein